MSAILKFDFQKREQLRFSEVNNYTQKRPNFACGNYIFPKTRGKKNKPWTHSTPLKRKHFENNINNNDNNNNKNKTKQNKTKQNKTKQNKTKQNKTKQNRSKLNKTKQRRQTDSNFDDLFLFNAAWFIFATYYFLFATG